MEKGRNGEIDFLRFIFAIIILLFHSQYLLGSTYPFIGGSFGVEFFFIVSGYLMEQSIEKRQKTPPQKLGLETFSFVKKKAFAVWPEIIISYILGFAFSHIVSRSSIGGCIDSFFCTVWELLFVRMTGLGINEGINPVVWYISSMLLCMMIIFPLLRWNRDISLHIILPLVSMCVIGFLFSTGHLRSPYERFGFFLKGNLKAFGELSLGILLYHVTEKLKLVKFNYPTRILISIIKSIFFLSVFAYMWFMKPVIWDFSFLLILVFAVGVVFSGQGIDSRLYNNRFCFFLGKFSLPLFLSHIFYSMRLNYILPETMGMNAKMGIYVACSLLTAAIVMFLSNQIRKKSRSLFWKSMFLKPDHS